MKKFLQSKKTGSAIPLVLIAIVLLSVMGAGLISLGYQSRAYAIRTTSDIAARNAADAGLTKAIFQMNEKLKAKPWNGSTLPMVTNESLTNCDGTLSYTVALNDGVYCVESIGTSGQRQKEINATLRLSGPFEYAIFVDSYINLENGAVIDWYNNEAGDENLRIGTNSIEAGAISLKTGATVNGDIIVGENGNPDIVVDDLGATITGDIYASDSYELDLITLPQYLQDLPSQGTISNSATITTSTKYDGINLASGGVITVDGEITLYITGDIILDNSASLDIADVNMNPDASLVLYLGGNLEGKYGSSINNRQGDAKKFKIYGLDNCQNMRFKNSSSFYGVIYAPNAAVIFDNGADAFGSIVAKSFEQKNSAKFTYDESLRNVSINDAAVRFVVKRWSE
ncbi:MAG: DUF7305 domain-containing protein [Planctomycetota bacterium]